MYNDLICHIQSLVTLRLWWAAKTCLCCFPLVGYYCTKHFQPGTPCFDMYFMSVKLIYQWCMQSEANDSYQFQRGLILYTNLRQGAFDTAFLVPNSSSGQRTIQISTLEQTVREGYWWHRITLFIVNCISLQNKYQRTFKLDQLPCPLGNVLTAQRNGLYSCQCNSLNPSIADCNNTIIVSKVPPCQFFCSKKRCISSSCINFNSFPDLQWWDVGWSRQQSEWTWRQFGDTHLSHGVL